MAFNADNPPPHQTRTQRHQTCFRRQLHLSEYLLWRGSLRIRWGGKNREPDAENRAVVAWNQYQRSMIIGLFEEDFSPKIDAGNPKKAF